MKQCERCFVVLAPENNKKENWEEEWVGLDVLLSECEHDFHQGRHIEKLHHYLERVWQASRNQALEEGKRLGRGKVGTIYKGKCEELDIKFSRVWAMPSAWTFTIRPIAELLGRYVGDGKDWIDPFCGKNSPAEITNDHNPEIKAMYNLDVLDFIREIGEYKRAGILFDPPYSFTQISQHYKSIGRRASKYETSMSFYEKPKSALCEKVKKGGYVISFGWNTNGFGKRRGFKIIEIMAVAHGGSKNDTIVTVEQKV